MIIIWSITLLGFVFTHLFSIIPDIPSIAMITSAINTLISVSVIGLSLATILFNDGIIVLFAITAWTWATLAIWSIFFFIWKHLPMT